MKLRIKTLFATAAAATLLTAGAALADPAPPAPAPYPAMSASISANGHPTSFDAGPLGNVLVTGVLSGGGFYQSNPQYSFEGGTNAFTGAPREGYGDVTNALVVVNKNEGMVQFNVVAGAYSLAALGFGYIYAKDQIPKSFGFVPQAFVKIVPNGNFSIMAGQLPTLVGNEYTFTFQNINIQRGLLWSQENVFTKGVQVNFAQGPFSLSVSLNDGFDSDVFNTVSGLAAFTLPNSDVLAFAASAATGEVRLSCTISVTRSCRRSAVCSSSASV